MIESERRQSPRLNPEGIKANISLKYRTESTHLEGEVIDISHTGVKILLNTPMPDSFDHTIRIDFLLPESGIPLTISGILKHHRLNPTELGVQYIDIPTDKALDSFMFECVKLAKH